MCENKCNIFIFSSSACVYNCENKAYLREDDEVKPLTPYGRSKVMIE
jgi:UDP-glucose 4-epimerase